MESAVRSPEAGVVRAIYATPGESVGAGQLLAAIEVAS